MTLTPGTLAVVQDTTINPLVPQSEADLELAVDPYFPSTLSAVPALYERRWPSISAGATARSLTAMSSICATSAPILSRTCPVCLRPFCNHRRLFWRARLLTSSPTYVTLKRQWRTAEAFCERSPSRECIAKSNSSPGRAVALLSLCCALLGAVLLAGSRPSGGAPAQVRLRGHVPAQPWPRPSCWAGSRRDETHLARSGAAAARSGRAARR